MSGLFGQSQEEKDAELFQKHMGRAPDQGQGGDIYSQFDPSTSFQDQQAPPQEQGGEGGFKKFISDLQAAKGDPKMSAGYSKAPDMSQAFAGAGQVPNLLNFAQPQQQQQDPVKSPGFNKYLQSLLGV